MARGDERVEVDDILGRLNDSMGAALSGGGGAALFNRGMLPADGTLLRDTTTTAHEPGLLERLGLEDDVHHETMMVNAAASAFDRGANDDEVRAVLAAMYRAALDMGPTVAPATEEVRTIMARRDDDGYEYNNGEGDGSGGGPGGEGGGRGGGGPGGGRQQQSPHGGGGGGGDGNGVPPPYVMDDVTPPWYAKTFYKVVAAVGIPAGGGGGVPGGGGGGGGGFTGGGVPGGGGGGGGGRGGRYVGGIRALDELGTTYVSIYDGVTR